MPLGPSTSNLISPWIFHKLYIYIITLKLTVKMRVTFLLSCLVYVCVCVCVHVCFHPMYSGRQTCGCTSRGHTGGSLHRISPSSFCGACLNFYREKDSAILFSRRPSSRMLCAHKLIALHLLGVIYLFIYFLFILLIYFLVRKNEKSQFV